MNTQKEEMVSRGYKMSDDGHESVLKMLRKSYPNYKDEYVLWLDFNFYSKYICDQIDAKIEFYDENWSLIQVAVDTLKDAGNHRGGLIRRPYPNKNIRQIGMKSGRKRIYGFPLLFDAFAELSKIAHIRVIWDVYHSCYCSSNSERPYMVDYSQLVLDIETHFVESDGKWYTIHSQDILEHELQEISDTATSEQIEQHNNHVSNNDAKFDYKYGYTATIEIEDFEESRYFVNNYSNADWGRIISDSNEEMISEDKLSDKLASFHDVPLNFERISEIITGVNPVCKYDCYFKRNCYATLLEIKPSSSVGFTISSCFGFD